MSLSHFFSIASAPFFFKEDDPHSIMIEFLEGSTAWIDHSRWIGSLWRFWVFVVREIVWRRWISIPVVGD